MSGYGSSGYGLGPYGYTPIFDGLDMGIQVLLDDGTGTFPYDVTTYVRVIQGWTIQRGRQDELSTVTAGSLSLTLDNADGRFSLDSTLIASPSPIKVDARIRVMETANATTFTRFTGYVVSWPVAWPSGGDGYSTVTITAMDAQARAERWVLKSLTVQEVLGALPSRYYALDEPSGATAAFDSSGNQAPMFTPAGTGPAITFGSGGATFANAGASTSNYLTGPAPPLTPITVTTGTFMCAFVTTSTGHGNEFLVGYQGAGQVAALVVDNTGHLTTGADFALTSVGSVADGQRHVAVLTIGSGTCTLYLDGATVGSSAVASVASSLDLGIYFSGTVSNFATFATALSSATVASVSNAILNGFAGESGVDRITRLAGYANLPVGTPDASLTNVPATDVSGSSAWDAIQEVADAEFGIAFFDGAGNLTFHNRNRPAGKAAPDITIDAEFLDEGTAFTVDMQGAFNYFEVTALGSSNGTQVVRNATSDTAHGRYPGSASYLVQTDQEALDRGNWIVSNHAEPAPRVGSLTIDLLTMSAAQQAAMLALEPDTWLRVTNLPGQTPGGTTADFIVQGFTETLNDTKWTIDANVVSKSLTDCLILDDATRGTLDSGNRLYV